MPARASGYAADFAGRLWRGSFGGRSSPANAAPVSRQCRRISPGDPPDPGCQYFPTVARGGALAGAGRRTLLLDVTYAQRTGCMDGGNSQVSGLDADAG